MKRKTLTLTTIGTCLALVLSFSSNGLLAYHVSASSKEGGDNRADKMSSQLRSRADRNDTDTVKTVVQLNGSVSGKLNAFFNRAGVHCTKHFSNFNVSAVELPASM